jgi:beta-N-acetylhexosaminidase
MPRIEKNAEQLWSHDLYPYRVLASRLPMVMVAHAAYPFLEADLSTGGELEALPASLSLKIVSDLLKRKIGFGGLVISDDLEMGGVLEGRTGGEAAVAAVRAGCEALLVCRHSNNVRAAFEAVLREAERDSAFRAVVERASRKVAAAREQLPRELAPFAPSSRVALREDIRKLDVDIRRKLRGGKGSEG